jgi:predicted PurR-regulated permease PerM
MKTKDKIILTTLIAALFFWLLYSVKSVLTPFVLALVIAYLLNPITTYLTNKIKAPRLLVTSVIIGLFFLILTLATLFIVPIIYSEFTSFAKVVPQYLGVLIDDFYPQVVELAAKFGVTLGSDIFTLMSEGNLGSYLPALSKNFFTNLLNSTLGLINILSLIFITPILVFYLLNDWEALIVKTKSYLPKKTAREIEGVFVEIDKILSGYIHGQVNVCLILGMIYATLLSFSGLDFGFLIGFLTGLLSFIPYVGMLFGVTAAIIIALFQWGFDSFHIFLVAGIFIFGQLIESNFLTPKLIGEKIGLHALWVMFGLFFFGSLFGFVGILAAVPMTAILGVIIRFFAAKYKKNFT